MDRELLAVIWAGLLWGAVRLETALWFCVYKNVYTGFHLYPAIIVAILRCCAWIGVGWCSMMVWSMLRRHPS